MCSTPRCAAKRAALMPTWRRPVSQPAAWPRIGVPCLGAHSPSTMASPLPLSTVQVPDAAGYFITHGVPRHAKSQTGSTNHVDTHAVACIAANPGLAHSEAAFPPSLLAQHAFHAHQGEQPTGGQSSCGPAAWPGTGAPYSGARSPSTAPPSPPVIPKAAAHHWERQHRSQPRAHPSGVSRAAPPPLPLHTTTRVSHARRSAAHRRAIQARRQHGRGPARHIRRASLIIESGHIAATHGGKEASCLAAPRLTHHSGHRDHPRAVRHPPITTWATQAADAFAKTLPSSTSPRPLAYARSEGECCK